MTTKIRLPSRLKPVTEAGIWLSENMPNPPIDEPQRYNIYTDDDGVFIVEFADEQDALMFSLSVQL